MDIQRRKTPWSRNTPQKEPPKQLETYKEPTYNMETINGTIKGGDLLLIYLIYQPLRSGRIWHKVIF